MTKVPTLRKRAGRMGPVLLFTALFSLASLLAGVSKELQNYYNENYRNRALYLKIPVHGFRQVVRVGSQPELDRSTLGQPLAFKVGDQVRILELNFKNDFIRFKIGAVDLSRESEIVFQFPAPLTSQFPQGGNFDAALNYTFTAGTNYKEIDTAKETFITDQFDQLIERFASNTGTSRQYVIQTISEKNPEFEKNKRLLAERDRELAAVRQQLETERAAKQSGERDFATLQRRLEDAESAADSLKLERSTLLDERDSLKERLQKLESDNQAWLKQKQDYEFRISQLARNLDLESSSKSELSTRVTDLADAIQKLKSDNAQLSHQLEELQKQHHEQTEALQNTEADRNKLAGDLRALTSDKKGLNSRYLESRKQSQALETALRLAAGLAVTRKPGEEGASSIEVTLRGRKVGTLQVEPPSAEPFHVRFEMVSPDTVEFSDEERRLWDALGEGASLRVDWLVADANLKPELVDSEPEQKVAPRETAEWTFRLPSVPSSPAPLRLQVSLLESGGHEVPMAGLDFEAQPSGLGSVLNGGVSWLSLLIGLAAGAGTVALMKLGGRRQTRPAPPRPAAASKKL